MTEVRVLPLALAGATLAIASPCRAQWSVVVLHPQEAQYSGVGAVYGQEAGGLVNYFQGGLRATVWDLPNGTGTNLEGVAVTGMWGNQRVGTANQAYLWQGATGMSLHPAGAGMSNALAVREGMQVGWTAMPHDQHAALWLGTPESYTDLHPAGAIRSEARATDGVFQGGWVQVSSPIGTAQHAALWQGSAASFVDLNPPGALQSKINGMAPGQQVGWTHPGTSHRAAVWSGTAQSWTDFHPAGLFGTSELYATTGAVQVGFISIGLPHATIWFGSPNDYLDLHALLPAGFSDSIALAVYQKGNSIVVGGVAFQGGARAIVWVGKLPPCYANCDGSTTVPILTVSDFACFLQRFAAGDEYANCDGSTTQPVLNVADFGCFLGKFAAGCSTP